jgi:hypothetical protein
MQRARWIGLGVIVIAIAMTASTLLRRKPEPEFRGRSLTSWLKQATEPAKRSKRVIEARNAINAIGADQAIPVLVQLAGTKQTDRSFNDWLMEFARSFNINLTPTLESSDPTILAMTGFEVLGTNAGAAVPALAKLVQKPDHSASALQCLAAIGEPARDVISDALKSDDPQTRVLALWSLTSATGVSDAFWTNVQSCVVDPQEQVRSTAIQVIGSQLRAPEKVVPLLMLVLRRNDTNEIANVANQLSNFGTNAAVAFGTLSNFAYEIPHSLAGFSSLRAMTVIAPDRTLPLLSHRLHSVDAGLRAQALILLVRDYPKPVDAIPAVEYAATDPEEFIATRAEEFLNRVKTTTTPSAR